MIDAVTGGREVTRTEEPRLYNLLENLCISRGITMPKLKVMELDALNAFATGMNEKQYSISITSGLLGRLNDAEIEAVLGHELTHIRNGDVRMMVIAVIIAGIVVVRRRAGVPALVLQWLQLSRIALRRQPRRRRRLRNPDRHRAPGRRLLPVVRRFGLPCRARANFSPTPVRSN